MAVARGRATSSGSLVQELVNRLSACLDDGSIQSSPIPASRFNDGLQQLRHLLVDSSTSRRSKDAFRRAGGFEELIRGLAVFSATLLESALDSSLRSEQFEVIKASLLVLSDAISDNPANQFHFASPSGIDGWSIVESALSNFIPPSVASTMAQSSQALYELESLFGVLFAMSLCEDSFISSFRNSKGKSKAETAAAMPEAPYLKHSEAKGPISVVSTSSNRPTFRPTDFVRNSEAVSVLFKLWRKLYSNPDDSIDQKLSTDVISALRDLVKSSEFNIVAVHKSDILKLILETLFTSELPTSEYAILESIGAELLKLGMNNLNDAAYFFSAAEDNTAISKKLLAAVKLSRRSSHFLFDLSISGFASLEFAELPTPFPPKEHSLGYTFTAWIYVQNFDDACHTTIFGAFDESQVCFVLIYLESRTHQLVLQTSISSQNPSTRFKSVTFEEHRWYHITLVHQRDRPSRPPRASLFVNGKFMEQRRCRYPDEPPANTQQAQRASKSGTKLSSATVQCFFGTPHDLSPRLGPAVLSAKWALAGAHLFIDVLPEELLLAFFQMGPSYHGNFQDALGSFQTYKASTQLNVLNEEKNGPNAEQSKLANAVKLKASQVNPEHSLSMSLSPCNLILRPGTKYLRIANAKIKALLENYFHGASNDLVINSSVPLLARALTKPSGFGSLTGGTVVFSSLSLEDCSWRLSGCVPTSIQLVARASSMSSLLVATEIYLELIRENWRNSEAMERGNGFGLLAWVLRAKIFPDSSTSGLVKSINETGQIPSNDSASMRTLFSLILKFLGIDLDSPQESLLNNPLGYRQLVVDCNIWERMGKDLQNLYYTQFKILTSQSQYKDFNVRRLSRMRIVKKMIDSMRERTVDNEVLPGLITTLRLMVVSNFTMETLRSLALYITFALAPGDDSGGKRLPPKILEDASRSPVASAELGAMVLEMLADILCENTDNNRIHKFARTVTTKWLLNLIVSTNIRIATAAVKILVRALLFTGGSYLAKFEEKHGFLILRKQLPRYWTDKSIWTRAWQLLLGLDIPVFDDDGRSPHADLLKTIETKAMDQFYCPEMAPVLLAMIQCGLRCRLSSSNPNRQPSSSSSSSLGVLPDFSSGEFDATECGLKIMVLLHGLNPFQTLSTTYHFSRDLVTVLFEATRDNTSGTITVAGEPGSQLAQNIDTTNSENIDPNALYDDPQPELQLQTAKEPDGPSGRPRRTSSFVMVNPKIFENPFPEFQMPLEPITKLSDMSAFQDSLCQQCVQLLVCILVDQIMNHQDFSGVGLFLKAPPDTLERRSAISSLILSETIGKLSKDIAADLEALHEPKTLMNITRFLQQTYEALLEGWFVNGSHSLLDFMATVLEYLNKPTVRVIKVVRLCSPSIILLQGLFKRLTIFTLLTSHVAKEGAETSFANLLISSEAKAKENASNDDSRRFQLILQRLDLLFSPESENVSSFGPKPDSNFLSAFCYILCHNILQGQENVRLASSELLRELISRNQREIQALGMRVNMAEIWSEFIQRITYPTYNTQAWLTGHREDIKRILNDSARPAIIQFVDKENTLSRTMANSRLSKREDRLNQRHLNELTEDHAWTEFNSGTKVWANSIFTSEVLKHYRARQDYQDNQEYIASLYRRNQDLLSKQSTANQNETDLKWALDGTEGRSRMRIRLLPSKDAEDLEYRPKRRRTISARKPPSSHSPSPARTGTNTPQQRNSTPVPLERQDQSLYAQSSMEVDNAETFAADEFELIRENDSPEEEAEDKNRKVMRSLQRGEKVHDVYNVSQIRGLEAVETLLIVGEKSLYLLSNLFQRQDGEIVNVWQASPAERDPYTQMITGREVKRSKRSAIHDVDTGTRHWSWSDIISISKRRFLSRPVALEIFFQDGRSYLLTAPVEQDRNKLYSILFERAVKLRLSTTLDDESWRIELLPNPKESPQTVGSRLVSAFNLGSILPATTRWIKGEISNFQYLMMVNTMAGRTFNDLTQYPVFPWVIADYTSNVLDLNNPKTYRDLTKPMGCQNSGREEAFKERFKAFADMSEHSTPAFHYGTHYSTAMIVTSYLIRLQPFVDAYLLLQGGSFDHADRLFYSLEKAWLSASQETMTDVRELTPEFFYLPDFLKNINKYDFGSREANGEKINDVVLPPWAKGDPDLFIAKNREALESPYVSQNLHSWIDLVFGFKQRGEAAIEAVNVFHHLSYQDATNLDTMDDLHERLATIGIIHNFGQTPSQVFLRPHERRESSGLTPKILPRLVNSLSRLPEPIYEHHSQISQLEYSTKQQRLLCCGSWRTFMNAKYNVVVDWAHSDHSVRFYNSETKKGLGLCEQLHQDIITAAKFVDKTLITASYDCTVGIWNMVISPDSVDAQQRGVLFAHRHPVTVLSVSRPLSTILSADLSGRVLLWDLNSLDLVREINLGRQILSAQINNLKGHILLCCEQKVLLYTLNGTLLVDQVICSIPNDRIYCSAFYENTGSEYIDAELIFTGHRWGVINAWNLVSCRNGLWKLELVRRLDHVDRSTMDGHNLNCAITAICPLDQVVYTGDEEGRVFEWTCAR